MTSPQVLEPDSRTRDRSRGLTDRLSRHPVAAGLTSGLLLWSAFPPVEWSWLGWLALVPLFWLAIQTGPRLRLYLGAWAGGLRLLAALRPVGAADRSDGLAGLAGHGHRLLVLVADLPGAHAAGGLPARHPPDDGGSDPLGGHGVHPGSLPERLSLVLPGP